MTTADEYRGYAKECLRWADEAETDDLRQSFLDMARDWTLAALHLEGTLGPTNSDPPSARLRQKTQTGPSQSA
jgi:hypothetical protein